MTWPDQQEVPMSSIDRPVSGDVLQFSLEAERKQVNDRSVLEKSGRNARRY
jgi:hypothetical protein